MGRVLPKGSIIPRVGHEVTVLVGEPIDLSDITCRCNQRGIDQQQVRVCPLALVQHGLHHICSLAANNFVGGTVLASYDYHA